MNVTIRKATPEDAYGINYVSAHSWKETYTGLIDDNYLNEKINNIETNIPNTKEFLKDKDTYYVALIDNQIIGILHYDKSDNPEYNEYGKLKALYLLKKYQKLGIGKKLFQIAVQGLIDMGYNKMYLECLKNSPTNNFYQHFGGKVVETIDYPLKDLTLKANIIIFNNLKIND